MDQSTAEEIVLDRAFPAADLAYLLERSKGKDADDGDFYRPYWVAAKLWATSKKKRMTEGEGAKWSFTSTSEMIQGLLDLQKLEDAGLTIPKGYEATIASILGSGIPRTVSVPVTVSF